MMALAAGLDSRLLTLLSLVNKVTETLNVILVSQNLVYVFVDSLFVNNGE